MPPRKRLKANATPTKTRRGGRRKKHDEDELPQIYQEMLAEAAMSSRGEEASNDRSTKRRRVSLELPEETFSEPSPSAEAFINKPILSPVTSKPSQRPQQVVYDDFGSSEDEFDVEFEDVAFEEDSGHETEDHTEQAPLQLDLTAKTPIKPAVQRRKPVSKAERDYRLSVHKTHLLLLLMNVRKRRHWCESEDVQEALKPLISRKLRNMLHIDDDEPDYQRAHSFNKAIQEVCKIWCDEFEITGQGMRSAIWREDVDAQRIADDFDDPSSYGEFLEAAGTRHGSRDLGAMLFCALLRSAAVETRLVCSLQVLPFSAVAKGQTPEKPKAEYAYRAAWPSQELPSSSHADPSNARWRQSEYAGSLPPKPQARQTKKKIHDSPYPISWVEVMMPTTHTWIPLDPLVRKTINKPKTGFEPPLSDSLNSMTYVMAFEDSGFVKDVTRRYTQFFNAKTRKVRVESTKHGGHWWTVTMQWFRRFQPMRSLSNVIEDKELSRRSENEPMPKNISDFKDHPVYALERHLRRNEIIWPDEHRGFISAGNKDGKSEKVYHRKNVHVVGSADQWYRKGRDLKVGEQPLKRVAAQKQRELSVDEDEDGENQDGTALYAEFQTDIYVPPPVVRGRIPKNQYGNLDIYVPTMIPPGAIHLQHPEARNAARILGVDFTDAVTGFKFKGRHGTAVVDGVVAAAEYREALVGVVEALEYERVREQEEKRSLIALSLWKKFMTALQIRRRIDEEHNEHDHPAEDAELHAASPADDEDEDGTYGESDGGAGGFMPDADEQNGENDDVDAVDLALLTLDPQQASYHEVVVVESPHRAQKSPTAIENKHDAQPAPTFLPKDSLFDDDGEDDLFDGSESAEPGGFFREGSEDAEGGGFLVGDDEPAGNGGDFMPTNDDKGGGFVVDEDVEDLEEQRHEPDPELVNNDEQRSEVPSPQGEVLQSVKKASSASNGPQTAAGEVHGQNEEEDNDAASLLSHDPDDDDADEAWAMDIDE